MAKKAERGTLDRLVGYALLAGVLIKFAIGVAEAAPAPGPA